MPTCETANSRQRVPGFGSRNVPVSQHVSEERIDPQLHQLLSYVGRFETAGAEYSESDAECPQTSQHIHHAGQRENLPFTFPAPRVTGRFHFIDLAETQSGGTQEQPQRLPILKFPTGDALQVLALPDTKEGRVVRVQPQPRNKFEQPPQPDRIVVEYSSHVQQQAGHRRARIAQAPQQLE